MATNGTPDMWCATTIYQWRTTVWCAISVKDTNGAPDARCTISNIFYLFSVLTGTSTGVGSLNTPTNPRIVKAVLASPTKAVTSPLG